MGHVEQMCLRIARSHRGDKALSSRPDALEREIWAVAGTGSEAHLVLWAQLLTSQQAKCEAPPPDLTVWHRPLAEERPSKCPRCAVAS